MRIFIIVAMTGAILLGSGTRMSNAASLDAKVVLTFQEPVQIPGTALKPGTYVIRRVDPLRVPGAVQFLNADETRVYGTIRTVPVHRETPTSVPVVTFGESRKDAPRPIKALFYPGDPVGDELIYETRTFETSEVAFAPMARALNEPAICTNDDWFSFDLCRRTLLDEQPARMEQPAPSGN